MNPGVGNPVGLVPGIGCMEGTTFASVEDSGDEV